MVARLLEFLALNYSDTWILSENKLTSLSLNPPEMVTSPTPPHASETYCMKLPSHATSEAAFESELQSQNDKIAYGFYVRFDELPPGVEMDFFICASGNSYHHITLALETDGDLRVEDSAGATVVTVTDPFTVDTWHRIEILWEKSSSAELVIHLDGVEIVSETGVDMDAGSTTVNARFQGQVGSPGTDTHVFINSFYHINDAVAVGSFLGEWSIYTYQADNTGSADDCDSAGTPGGGSNLGQGTWDLTSNDANDGTGTAARYTNSAEGAVAFDDSPSDGPSGDTVFGSQVGVKWVLGGTVTNVIEK